MFDPSSNQWRMVSPMETHRRGIAVGYLCGAIYAVGGLDDSACFNTVERYDIEADKWTFVASMNVQRGKYMLLDSGTRPPNVAFVMTLNLSGGVGVGALRGSFTGHMYAVGGNDGTSSLDSCERYDPHLNKWTVVASMSNRYKWFKIFITVYLLFHFIKLQESWCWCCRPQWVFIRYRR